MTSATTPVVVAVAQTIDRLGEPDYACASSIDLAAQAIRAALADAGIPLATIGQHRSALATVRPFELSGPGMRTLGPPTNFPRAIAARAGINPAHAVLEVVGGQSPQSLVAEYAGRIAADEFDLAIVVGAEALSTLHHFLKQDQRPDFTDTIDGQVEDRGFGYEYYLDEYSLEHGLFSAPAAYALIDNARRAERGASREDYLGAMARLFAPFSEVAAANPFSSVRQPATAAELARVDADNPMIWDPYPRRLIAREKVNLGAAVVLMSSHLAASLTIDQDQWVYLHGHANAVELPFLERPSLAVSQSALIAVEESLAMAGLGIDDVAAFDLYSCFAAPVFNVRDGFGIAESDPRPLTVTGGLPFFGGPGNNYSTHGIVEMVERARRDRGSFGLVGANGGIQSKYSVGIYSTTPTAWSPSHDARVKQRVTAQMPARLVRHPEGHGTIASYTFRMTPDGPQDGIVVGEMVEDGRRFLARMDPQLAADAVAEDPIGRVVRVTSRDGINHAAG